MIWPILRRLHAAKGHGAVSSATTAAVGVVFTELRGIMSVCSITTLYIHLSLSYFYHTHNYLFSFLFFIVYALFCCYLLHAHLFVAK